MNSSNHQISWEPFLRPGEVPSFVPPPTHDVALIDRIEKTAAFAVGQHASGAAFLSNLMNIHRSDPLFQFLLSHDPCNSYFKHRLHSLLYAHAPPPHHWLPPSSLGPPQVMPSQPPPEPPKPVEPVSSFTFPPGLLPKLCADKGKIWAPYRPLEQDDILSIGLPPAPSTNPYLRSQIDRFFAEVHDYRQGAVRTRLDESTQDSCPTVKDKEEGDRGERGASRIRRYYQQASKKPPAAGMMDDGTFAGSSVSQHAGLGVRSSTDDDAYASYRRAISTGYHDMIRSEAGQGYSNMARGGR